MDFSRLERNLIDNIREAQLKLGYENRPMSLNYMLTSLNHLLGADCGYEDMPAILEEFTEYSAPRLGKLSFRLIKDGYCITIPADGTAYVNDSSSGSEFIAALINAVRGHVDSIEQIVELFRKYSDAVTVKDGNGEDFDKLVYFSNGVPDEYYYCLTEEPCMGGGCHVIYHRFIREDFEELGF